MARPTRYSMMLGCKLDAREVGRALDCLFRHPCATTGMNASNLHDAGGGGFDARQILFALPSPPAIARLTGPLHGGAPGSRCWKCSMRSAPAEAASSRGSTARWAPRGRRLMGFGPPRLSRSAIRRAPMCAEGCDRAACRRRRRLTLRRARSRALHSRRVCGGGKNPDRPLDTNVEFFTAILARRAEKSRGRPFYADLRGRPAPPAGPRHAPRASSGGGRLDTAEFGPYIGPMPG